MVIFLMAKDLFGNRGKSRLETTVWAIQLLLFLVGIITIVLVLKTAVIPYSFSKVSTLPQIWLSLKFWLSPPYIYIVINFIIVFIAVSSTFHHQRKSTTIIMLISIFLIKFRKHHHFPTQTLGRLFPPKKQQRKRHTTFHHLRNTSNTF